MVCDFQCRWHVPSVLSKRSWISWDLQKRNLSANNLSDIRNNMKSRIVKTQFQIVELLIPTLNEGCSINSYLLCCKRKIMNNHNKILSCSILVSCLNYLFQPSFHLQLAGAYFILCSLVNSIIWATFSFFLKSQEKLWQLRKN